MGWQCVARNKFMVTSNYIEYQYLVPSSRDPENYVYALFRLAWVKQANGKLSSFRFFSLSPTFIKEFYDALPSDLQPHIRQAPYIENTCGFDSVDPSGTVRTLLFKFNEDPEYLAHLQRFFLLIHQKYKVSENLYADFISNGEDFIFNQVKAEDSYPNRVAKALDFDPPNYNQVLKLAIFFKKAGQDLDFYRACKIIPPSSAYYKIAREMIYEMAMQSRADLVQPQANRDEYFQEALFSLLELSKYSDSYKADFKHRAAEMLALPEDKLPLKLANPNRDVVSLLHFFSKQRQQKLPAPAAKTKMQLDKIKWEQLTGQAEFKHNLRSRPEIKR